MQNICVIHMWGIERMLSMHEAQEGSIPCFSIFILAISSVCTRGENHNNNKK
jgi:hypothetical protein